MVDVSKVWFVTYELLASAYMYVHAQVQMHNQTCIHIYSTYTYILTQVIGCTRAYKNIHMPVHCKMHVIHAQVQDLTQSTIALLRYISAITPATSGRGFVFAGDSAQTIARGVNFRFQALR